MQVAAKLRHLHLSPRKVRLVADIIRGQNVEHAVNLLSFTNKRAARPLLKLLNSAIANAENNFKLKKNNLYISELRVDEGPTLKRWMPRAMGRATPINKRTSHISIVLNEKVATPESKDKKKDKGIVKDVKVVKSLDEVKELGKKEELEEKKKLKSLPAVSKETVQEKKDVRREGSDRSQQHLDKTRKKGKGGILKKVFRRKSI